MSTSPSPARSARPVPTSSSRSFIAAILWTSGTGSLIGRDAQVRKRVLRDLAEGRRGDGAAVVAPLRRLVDDDGHEELRILRRGEAHEGRDELRVRVGAVLGDLGGSGLAGQGVPGDADLGCGAAGSQDPLQHGADLRRRLRADYAMPRGFRDGMAVLVEDELRL